MKLPDEKPISTTNRVCPYLTTVFALPEVFTPEECKQIINTGLNHWKEEPALVGGIDDLDFRNTTLFTPQEPVEWIWIFNKIFEVVLNFNSHPNGYQFNIQGLFEPPNLMRYQAANIDKHGKPGHCDWHMDVSQREVPSMRKISYSLILNPDEYEGGELCFHIGRNLDEPFEDQDKIGTMIVFPSYIMHKVMPVTSGTRYAIVGWAHGNSFI